ncbi:MAG: Uma2 family endonuclease [Ardenticatenales bacterium]|nr:Uma2 family endonuclease [Ardenticatenales bacterium]
MSSLPHPPFITPETYLARERQATTKSEYLAGTAVAMSGASRAHNLIVTNLVRELSTQLAERPCEVYPSDMRVHIPAASAYTYPDVVVVCGEPEFIDEQFDTLRNPTLLVEMLSDSTEAYDRGKKFELYRRLPSLHLYLLVAQDEVFIERYVRQADNEWVLSDFVHLADSIPLEAIQVELSMAQVYRKVSFE